MFELELDLWMMIMFGVCGLVNVVTMMYNYTLITNNKGKE